MRRGSNVNALNAEYRNFTVLNFHNFNFIVFLNRLELFDN